MRVSMTNVRRASPASDSHTHIAQTKLAHKQIEEGWRNRASERRTFRFECIYIVSLLNLTTDMSQFETTVSQVLNLKYFLPKLDVLAVY